MLSTRDSPPPLIHSSSLSDRESSKSRETTPATPVVLNPLASKLLAQAVERAEIIPTAAPAPAVIDQLAWFRRQPLPAVTTTSLCTPSSPPAPDIDEPTFELFASPSRDPSMAVNALTHDRTSPRQPSTSPRGNQPSHLTAALKQSQSNERPVDNTPNMDRQRPSFALPESSDMSRFENGARPISMKGRPTQKDRRESLAQSLGMGMSWGGASVGSWIRDE